MRDNAETFLEDMVINYISEDELDQYEDVEFELEFGQEELELKIENEDDIAKLSQITFNRIKERRMD